MQAYVSLALTLTHSVYGVNQEKMCGDVGKPVACVQGARTSSGEEFNPDAVTAAVPAPTAQRTRITTVKLRAVSGECVEIRVNDKANSRFIGVRGLDLTPGALRALGIEPTKYWSGRIEMC